MTGVGAVSPQGTGAGAFFDGLVAGRSAIRRLPEALTARLAIGIGAPCDFDGAKHIAAPDLRMMDRVSQMALVAAGEALAQAGDAAKSAPSERIGVSMGVGVGGPESTDEGYRTLYAEGSDRIRPFSVLMAMTNAPAAWIALTHGLRGPSLTYSTACSSSAVAIGEAARRIAAGEADVVLAGGAEAPLTLGTLKAWEALKTLAPCDPLDVSASCKPFSKDRSGLVLGEGAAALVLEELEHARARGVPVLAEIAGYGVCTDASHITRPSVEGQARAMKLALDDAGMAAADIGYINAHGTGTQANDAVETAAIRQVFGSRADATPVSSTKSMHGHLLGGAGALELVAGILAMWRETLPPTMHLANPDPACDLDYVTGGARAAPGLGAVMSSSFAFGGTNAVLVARRI